MCGVSPPLVGSLSIIRRAVFTFRSEHCTRFSAKGSEDHITIAVSMVGTIHIMCIITDTTLATTYFTHSTKRNDIKEGYHGLGMKTM